ncbi:MAG TPA: ABC transporter ATP-binding protein [Vineibacter sp.]|nr:ABC transporter ATP-binding protein [Vineibacter sp.]
MTASATLLEIRGAAKSFGGVQALDGVDLHLGTGEVLGVIGPNGSGKTTLFNLLTGVVRASGGTARLAGANLLDLKPWEISALGVARTFQNIRLALGQSVLQNVLVGAYRQNRTSWWQVLLAPHTVAVRETQAVEKAMEALRFVAPALAAAPDRIVGELPYADRRRIELARAVVGNPRILLIDEPAAGMNPHETAEIADDILRIAARGMSILVIEHKMKFIATVAPRIAVLNFGRKIAEGSYEQIRTDPHVLASYLGRKGDHLAASGDR